MGSTPILSTMDIYTLEELLDEAKKSHKKAERKFNKWDNHEDMHEMEAWEQTIHWLKEKVKFYKKPA